jgi:hypothetical protein
MLLMASTIASVLTLDNGSKSPNAKFTSRSSPFPSDHPLIIKISSSGIDAQLVQVIDNLHKDHIILMASTLASVLT